MSVSVHACMIVRVAVLSPSLCLTPCLSLCAVFVLVCVVVQCSVLVSVLLDVLVFVFAFVRACACSLRQEILIYECLACVHAEKHAIFDKTNPLNTRL